MPEPTDRSIILCYRRKSVIRDGTDAISVIWQQEQADAEVKRRGKTAHWFEDVARHNSGRNITHRAGFRSLLESIPSPTTYAVLVTTQDRASRSVRDMADLIDNCRKHGVHFIAPGEGTDTTRDGWQAGQIANINMRATFAQFESDASSERVARRAAHYHAHGIQWGREPFGYARVGKGLEQALAPNGNAPAVVRCLRLFASGLSYDRTTTRLVEAGVPVFDRKGNPTEWDRETVRVIVGNVLTYCGFLPGQGWDAKDGRVTFEGEGTLLERHARAARATPSDKITPVIDPALAESVLERRRTVINAGRNPGGVIPLLTPIVWWNGQKLRADERAAGRVYTTRGAKMVWQGDVVEADLMSRLAGLAMPPTLIQRVKAGLAASTSDAQRAALAKEYDLLKKRNTELLDLLMGKLVTREDYEAKFRRNTARMGAIEVEQSASETYADRLLRVTDMARAIGMMTREKQRENIRRLFDRIDINDDGNIEQVEFRPWLKEALTQMAVGFRNPTAKNADGGPIPHHWPDALLWLVEHGGMIDA